MWLGRWNTEATTGIQSSEHYSTASLKRLLHANSVLSPNQHCISITVPNGIRYEVFRQRRIRAGTRRTKQCAKTLARRGAPLAGRPFRTPGVPWVPLCGIFFSLLLMLGLPLATWLRLVVWLILGLVIYFGDSHRHSLASTATGD